jgi:hypothetical protein
MMDGGSTIGIQCAETILRSTFVNRSFVRVILVATSSYFCSATENGLKAINGPHQIVFDSKGNLYIHEQYGNRILRLDLKENKLTVVAGNGHQCCRKENVRARKSSIYDVYSIAVDADNNVYLAGRNARDGAFVRVVHSSTDRIETIARGCAPAPALGVKLADANLSDPKGIVVTQRGEVLVSADESHVIVKLGPVTQLFAGSHGKRGFSGDGELASLAKFDLPGALATDGNGNVFVADYFNHRIAA